MAEKLLELSDWCEQEPNVGMEYIVKRNQPLASVDRTLDLRFDAACLEKAFVLVVSRFITRN